MKKCYPLPVLFLVFVSALLSGCGTMKQVQVVERIQKDTLYLNHIQYDSIYVDNWQLTDRTKDTIYLEKSHIEYRYKLLRDTVRIVQIDSIPVIREVEVIKTEKYAPSIYKWSLALVIVFVLVLVFVLVFVVYILWKIKFQPLIFAFPSSAVQQRLTLTESTIPFPRN